MKKFFFQSQVNPDKYVFCFTDDWDPLWNSYYRAEQPLHLFAWMSETYGDGMTMHTPLYAVGPEHFADYCLSLAKYLIDNPTIEMSRFFHAPSAERMAFAFKVKYNPDKPQWFNHETISANENKRYDKRWHEVKSVHDGTVWGAFNVLSDLDGENRKRDVIVRYATHRALTEFGRQLKQFVDPDVASQKILPDGLRFPGEDPTDHSQAFAALDHVLSACESRWMAERAFKNGLHNCQQNKPKTEEKAA